MTPLKKSTALKSLSGALVVIAIFPALYFSGILHLNYPSKTKYPIRGIDISHHQGSIDWQQINPKDIQFVFIKATEGGDYKDPQFLLNWKSALEARFITGAYHFFTLCKDGKTQAENFIATVPRVNDALPPVVDLEYVGNCGKRPMIPTFEVELKTFLSMIENHYRKKPIFYTTHGFIKDYLVSREFEKYPIWIRDVFWEPKKINGRDWEFWQFSDKFRITGINTFVDMNVFAGTLEELKIISGPHSAIKKPEHIER